MSTHVRSSICCISSGSSLFAKVAVCSYTERKGLTDHVISQFQHLIFYTTTGVRCVLKTTWPLHGNVEFWAHAGADPGFLERGFICINMWGGLALLILSNLYKISHENEKIWSH